MMTNDFALVGLEHKITEETARLAWAGTLDEEHKDELVYNLLPGPKATYRCCVYKEREVARQRVKLCCGENPRGSTSDNVVQVIKPACDECPISAYSVTDNCRLCMGKACLNSCKFDAIKIGEYRTHIDPSKCKECGMCANACPYGAIVHLERPCKKACPVGAISYDEYGYCVIDDEKCISCGHCIHSCPFGAITSKSYLPKIIEHIKNGTEVYAMFAPATEGQFGVDVNYDSLRDACIRVGFTDAVEVGLGADLTAAFESMEWAEAKQEGRKMTTSCCPAFINMLKKHFPAQFLENMSTTVSPMCATSRLLKSLHPGCITVFVGPCIAKKSESADESVPGNADYVMTYGEFGSLLKSKDVEYRKVEHSYQEGSLFGKRFASSGGVAAAVLECMEERGEDTEDIRLKQCAGGSECKTALTLLKAGRLPEDFIEGMICPGGCVGGPSKHRTEVEIKRARESLLKQADDRTILGNLASYPVETFSMHRDGHLDPEETRRVLAMPEEGDSK